VPVTLHNYHSPIATAAMVHFAVTTPACRYRQELRAMPHRWRHCAQPSLRRGWSNRSARRPWLGLELNEERIASYIQRDRMGRPTTEEIGERVAFLALHRYLVQERR